MDYQWQQQVQREGKALKELSLWNSNFGFKVLSRDEQGFAQEIEFRVYVGAKFCELYLVGDVNDWKDEVSQLQDYKFTIDEQGIARLRVKGIKHKQSYKLLQVQHMELKYHQDPAGVYFDDMGNSVFWDFEDPSCYKQEFGFVDTVHRSTKILQTDLAGLIVHFSDAKGIKGSEIDKKSYYKFITESGVIEKIKSFGFNTVQFLPFAQSIDGDNWKYSYLVPFLFAIQKNWGTPDDFAEMIDEFHKQEIAVICDAVIGHMPYRDFEIFGKSSRDNGIHTMVHDDLHTAVYLKEETSWGTKRPDFSNPYIREYLIDSCIHYQKYFKVDGFRIDNVDGILRYGAHGNGDERPFGREFLRDLHENLYEYNPYTLIHLEAHYFFEDNAKMLVAPIDSDSRALGATAYNESRLAYFFHREYMLKRADEISVWKFKYMLDEKEWGKSNSTIADFHNHDAAAGLMEERATGAYAVECMTSLDHSALSHAIGRIKVMEAIISFFQEGRTLDLLQTFLLQKGSFEHNSSIEWELEDSSQETIDLLELLKQVHTLMNRPSFWPLFLANRKVLNVDDVNKVVTVKRSAEYQGIVEEFIIVINTSSFELFDYQIGVETSGTYKQVFNSTNLYNLPEFEFNTRACDQFELLPFCLQSSLGSYEIQVFKKILE